MTVNPLNCGFFLDQNSPLIKEHAKFLRVVYLLKGSVCCLTLIHWELKDYEIHHWVWTKITNGCSELLSLTL